MTARLRPDLFLLDPSVVHLNHGSFGAVPTPVLEAQRRAYEAIERSPERFYRSDLAPAIDAVRTAVAAFLNTDPGGLALVANATEAVQVVLDAVGLGPAAEVVYTDHSYPWVKAAIARACARTGASSRCVSLPPLTAVAAGGGRCVASTELLASLRPAVTERTRLVVLDQITSASALRLPVEAVCEELGDQVPILIDGAHAPGLIERPVPTGAAFWLGNLHKWAFAARTAAALVVAPRFRPAVEPLVASAGASLGFPRSFTYLGTRDPTAFLALPASLAFPEEHLGISFSQLRARNTRVLDEGLGRVAARLGLRAEASNGLPIRTLALAQPGDDERASALTTRLRELGVEVAVSSVGGQLHARMSVQAYVALDDFERLGATLAAVL